MCKLEKGVNAQSILQSRRRLTAFVTNRAYASGMMTGSAVYSLRTGCLVGLSVVLLAGCAPSVRLGVAPSLLSDQWQDPRGPADPEVILASGWSSFGSEQLDRMITTAQRSNPDIAIAASRIEAARADLRVVRAVGGPVLGASGSASSDIRNLQGQTRSFDRIGSASLDVSYDIDLFGAAKAEKKAAWARLRAAGYDRRAIELAIEADVATGFVGLAALRERAGLADRARQNARELERIIRIRAREGVASQVELGLQTTEGDALEIDRSRLVEGQDRARTALAVLLGEEAPLFRPEPSSLATLTVPRFGLVQPGELVTRRPDIRAAEARIEAANGDVEAARRAFLPGLRLSAGSFFDVLGNGAIANGGASLSANLFATIFDRGRLKGQLYRASATQHEAVALYRKALITALAEVQDALTSSAQTRSRLDLLVRSQKEAMRTAQLARAQYREGTATLGTVLDADRRLVDVDDQLVQARQESLLAAIQLFRALGGPPAV
jgi:outer membrane protein, multidrug efflux system